MASQLRPAPRRSTSAGRTQNLLTLLDELRHADTLARTDLARITGLAIPTVHRLLAVLMAGGLAVEEPRSRAAGGLGRPASLYRFNHSVASVAGIDIGNETTRIAVAAANGAIISSDSLPTARIAAGLPGGLISALTSLTAGLPSPAGPLAGIGIGIAASVDPASGSVQQASIHRRWDGLPLQSLMEQGLGCPVTVQQDDHLSALAELSDRGTVPGASSLVVVNYGRGIGTGVVIDGTVIRGARGRAGRIAHWPAHGQPGATLAQQLLPDALAAAYKAQGGTGTITDGATLCQAARAADPLAQKLVHQAARGIADVFLRLAVTFDPDQMVMGGGFAGSFD
ncbi:MAG: ROK family transcriptional regulator, partial [Nocardiopsaceae bacterium]|nr:ROK family transcriptional regulator [Nocardiopsaceae bacterium]